MSVMGTGMTEVFGPPLGAMLGSQTESAFTIDTSQHVHPTMGEQVARAMESTLA